MKIRNVTTTIVLSLVCLSMSANAGIVEVGDGLGATLEDHLFDNFSDGGGAINANGDFFATYTVVDPTIGTFTFDYLVEGVAGGADGLAFDLAQDAGTQGPLFFLARDLATGSLIDNEFADGDVFNITISNVTTTAPGAGLGPVTFAGFSNIGTADTANNAGEGINVDGQDHTRGGTATNGDNDPRQGLVFQSGQPGPTNTGLVSGPTLSVRSLGTTSFRGVALSFEAAAVPEPTSAVFLGLGGLALFARRRR